MARTQLRRTTTNADGTETEVEAVENVENVETETVETEPDTGTRSADDLPDVIASPTGVELVEELVVPATVAVDDGLTEDDSKDGVPDGVIIEDGKITAHKDGFYTQDVYRKVRPYNSKRPVYLLVGVKGAFVDPQLIG